MKKLILIILINNKNVNSIILGTDIKIIKNIVIV